MRIAGLILAGGQGRRLTRDKGWSLVGGVPIVQRVRDALAPVVQELLLVGDAELPPDWPVRRVPDELPGTGPLAAMLTGMTAAPADVYLIVAWDMPFVTAELLHYLAAKCQDADAVVPHIGGRNQPLCAAYAASCLPAIEQCVAQGLRRADAFLPRVTVKRPTDTELSQFGDLHRLFLNVNTPEDLSLAEGLASR
ncbi:MAG: molybdenum cofactor guanylyltransferase [Armatimonadetes bacterium]|nr:molybdenum cofactor guanylyltransferase [Armatimonadota bacterium]